MKDETLEYILKQKTTTESYILESIGTNNSKKLDNKKIMSILHTILCWEEIDETIILVDKNIFSPDEDIMISKHHRFVDIPRHKHNFIELVYVYSGSYTQIVSGEKIVLNKDKISKILIYIEENYKKITLGEVAKEFHFHPNYLSTLIKKTTGKSFKNIIHEQIIKKAVTLLKNTDMNIEDISIEVGYNNQTFFYKKFKELYGMTPQIYLIKSNLLLREVSCEKIYS
ncbi:MULTISPECIES: response regulator transcription factor [unclassified Clostridioides]|uniref:AraC family transcriptional regulator n=1 Tax=unclassified Clostridioides TaxID=2635829 RepID=UPI001D10AC52